MSITTIHSKSGSQQGDHYETAFAPALDRLIELVNRQYGCELRYSPLMELSKDNLRTLRKQLHEDKPLYVGNEVFFPVIVRGELMGAAELNDVSRLTPAEVNQLHEVIGLVLESSLLNVCRLDVLSQLEEQLKIIDASPNVVRIDHAREVKVDPIVDKHYKKAFNLPCLIESKDPHHIHRAALEIYSRTDRHAFIPIHDLVPDVSLNTKALLELGPVSIFIPEITELSPDQQETLSDYLNTYCHPNGPQIIAGTKFDQKSLMIEKRLSKKLLTRISMAYLNLTSHNDRRVQSQIIHHFIEGVSQDTPPTTPML